MTRLAGLWNRLEDAEKEALFHAAQRAIGERGAELVRAIARHAEDQLREAPRSPAVDRGSGTRVIDARHVRVVCHDCRRVIVGKPVWRMTTVNGSRRPVWICAGCNRRTPREAS